MKNILSGFVLFFLFVYMLSLPVLYDKYMLFINGGIGGHLIFFLVGLIITIMIILLFFGIRDGFPTIPKANR